MAVQGIKGIIFDCFGVLYVNSMHAIDDMAPAGRRQELDDLSMGSDYGYISREDYLRGVSEITGRSYDEIVAEQKGVHVRNEALVAYIRELHRTYKIALLSNVGRDLIESLFTEAERSELFDGISLSYETNILKPQPQAFIDAASRLGLEPGECVMIDDLQKNIDGADAAGMRGIVYTNMENLKQHLTSVLGV